MRSAALVADPIQRRERGRGPRGSREKDDAMPGGKGLLDAWPIPFKTGHQRRRSAIAHAHPQQPTNVAVAMGQVEEVFILGNHNPRPLQGTVPDVDVRRGSKRKVKDVHGIGSASGEPACEGDGKLVVHHEPHVPARTTWSACRAE